MRRGGDKFVVAVCCLGILFPFVLCFCQTRFSENSHRIKIYDSVKTEVWVGGTTFQLGSSLGDTLGEAKHRG